MLLSVMLVSAAMIGATAIGGFVVIQQFKQVHSAYDSTQALFAADAGIESAMFCITQIVNCDDTGDIPTPTFSYPNVSVGMSFNIAGSIYTVTAEGRQSLLVIFLGICLGVVVEISESLRGPTQNNDEAR